MTDGSYLSARNVSNLLRQTAITGIWPWAWCS
jgi:ABC-type xylose transport system permease subunit